MMMIFIVLNCKAKASLNFNFIKGEYFQSTRILVKHWKQNEQKWKTTESESEKSKLVIKITNSGQVFPTIAVKSKASCQAPLTTTKWWDSLEHNLDVDKNEPLPPQLLQPPGLRLPGCSPPLQLPGPGHCQAGGPPPWSQTNTSANGQSRSKNWCK